jgi:ABC-2 type transport system permease protein
MMKQIIKFFKINAIIFRNAYIRDSKIPGFVITNIITQFLDISISIILFSVIFANTESMAGWNYWQVIFLYSFVKFQANLNGAWTKKGLKSMATDLIRLGDYDFFATKPFDSMLLVSISKPRLYSFIPLLFVIGLMFYSASKSGFDFGLANILWFLFLTIFSAVLYYFLTVITVIPAFWATRLSAITDFMNRAVQFAKYPSGVFSNTLRTLLSTVFPIIVISYFPVRTLFYPPQISYIIYMVGITFLFGYIARALWRWGEKNYGSASS